MSLFSLMERAFPLVLSTVGRDLRHWIGIFFHMFPKGIGLCFSHTGSRKKAGPLGGALRLEGAAGSYWTSFFQVVIQSG